MKDPKFEPVIEETDVPDSDTPKILLANREKENQLLDVVEGFFKRARGDNRPFIHDLRKLIASFVVTSLEATALPSLIHVYRCNRKMYIYSRNYSERVHFDESVSRDRHESRFFALDSCVDLLFQGGAKSIGIKQVFSQCGRLKGNFSLTFGLAECGKKDSLDGLLNQGNKLRVQSMTSLLRRLRVKSIKLENPIPNMYWFEMKNGLSASNGIFFQAFINDKLTQFGQQHVNRNLSVHEEAGKFNILIKKLSNGQIMLDDLAIDAKYDTNHNTHWYIWCILHLCSCKSYSKPAGFVLELSCNW